MEVFRYEYIFLLITLFSYCVNNENTEKENTYNNSTTNCPYTKLFEDIFRIRNKSSQSNINANESERVKLFLNTLANSSPNNRTVSAEDLVDTIIASINRIKNNITSDKINGETKLNEAIILNISTESTKSAIRTTEKNYITEAVKIKSGVEEKTDKNKLSLNRCNDTSIKCDNSDRDKTTNKEIDTQTTTAESTYVEILTIEPNNTKPANTTSHNIIDILKRLMPMFNSTLTKELHNITIIERTHNRNHSISTTKNISTIVVTYCDNENLTKANVTPAIYEEESFIPMNNSQIADYFDFNAGADNLTDDEEGGKHLINSTFGERKDILEAAEYGMQKMHELYSIMEPKLYSMGLWLEDSNPARYVAAFNAPSEEASRFTRYGYAALQAATRLKELTSYNDGLESRTEEAQFPGTSELRQAPLLQHCPLLEAPKCPPASKRYRTHDGTCNNLSKPRWGSTMTPAQRFLSPSYSDGLQAPRRSVTGSKLPSAREISSTIHQDQFIENHGITHLLMQWGQFIDHDITSTSQSRGFNGSVPRCCKDGGKDFVPREFLHPECFPISVPASDPFYGPRGIRCLDFIRSSPAPRGDCALGWRDQMNQVSAYIDGSPLYGSSARQSDKLRLFRNGMLQYGRVSQRRPVLPAAASREELCRGGAVSADCFRSGDARVNEHPGLVAKHIVWLRLHNRLAQELAHLNPHWSDEKIYQETRKIIGAMIQHITYREFLPVVLGGEVMRLFELEPLKKGIYKGYSPKVDPSPASSFGSAAFRFGHSLVQPSMVRYDRFHRPIDNNVSLHDELTNPSNIWSMGAVDRLLIGMVNQPIQKRDEFITEELTNHLFQTPQFSFGMDLAAINIQRGRDHGIPPYTSWREPCGLSAILEFEDLFRVMPARAVRKLEALYRSVDDIDLFTGGMAERPVVGGLVGPTFACIIAQQFSNLRKGDRFWYENGGFESSFTPAQLQQIRRISLAQVLCRTLDNIDNIQPFAFLSPEHFNNERISCLNGKLNTIDLSPWKEINSDSNDIGKSNDVTTSTQKPKNTKPVATTTKPNNINSNTFYTASDKLSEKRTTPSGINSSKSYIKGTEKIKTPPIKSQVIANTRKQNRTKINDALTPNETTTKLISTVQKIDDKLDFIKNKSRRYENSETTNTRNGNNEPVPKYNDYDYEDDTQSIQSVVINNSHNKRPYRPIIAVTENLNKFTYLINYVPKPTQSWRPTTKRSYQNDRDVIKVTYQNYDETYRRPTHHHYYNKQNHENRNNDFISYRHNRPTVLTTDKHTHDSSARSNDHDDINTTTENVHKLVTFRYVGTYKGDHVIEDTLTKSDKIDKNDTKQSISKDFSTYETKKLEADIENENKDKLSTFLFYDTVTKPYQFLQRPTRRDDNGPSNDESNLKNKYYYVKNVLHKYPNIDFTEKPLFKDVVKSILKENYIHPGYPMDDMMENRSDDQELVVEPKLIKPNRFVDTIRKPGDAAKTPSVSFQVIPSENSPSQWAVYEENSNLSEDLSTLMPQLKSDPHALKEFPKPLTLLNLRRRRPGRS